MARYADMAEAIRLYMELQRLADRASAARRPPQFWAAFEDLAELAPGVYVPMHDERRPQEVARARRAFYKE